MTSESHKLKIDKISGGIVMFNDGTYANCSVRATHTGTHVDITRGPLNNATLYAPRLTRYEYDAIDAYCKQHDLKYFVIRAVVELQKKIELEFPNAV